MLCALPRRGRCDPSKAQPGEGGSADGTEMTGTRRDGENLCVAPADLSPSSLLASLAILLSHCPSFNVPSTFSVFSVLVFCTGCFLGLGRCFPLPWLPHHPLIIRVDTTFSKRLPWPSSTVLGLLPWSSHSWDPYTGPHCLLSLPSNPLAVSPLQAGRDFACLIWGGGGLVHCGHSVNTV